MGRHLACRENGWIDGDVVYAEAALALPVHGAPASHEQQGGLGVERAVEGTGTQGRAVNVKVTTFDVLL